MYSGNGEDYKLGDTIGFGATSVVRLATYTPLGQLVAVKVMQLEQGRDSITSMQREVQLMSLSKHPNVGHMVISRLRPVRPCTNLHSSSARSCECEEIGVLARSST